MSSLILFFQNNTYMEIMTIIMLSILDKCI